MDMTCPRLSHLYYSTVFGERVLVGLKVSFGLKMGAICFITIKLVFAELIRLD